MIYTRQYWLRFAHACVCQTQIYEEEYETEHNDHKHTLQENRRLRKKREEMRQQVALLQEQVGFDRSKNKYIMIHS